jgi:hypothetical protein
MMIPLEKNDRYRYRDFKETFSAYKSFDGYHREWLDGGFQ